MSEKRFIVFAIISFLSGVMCVVDGVGSWQWVVSCVGMFIVGFFGYNKDARN